MDHRFIDQNAIAERYLRHALAPSDRVKFETHLVDCPECRDRLLLAEMFHARNGSSAIVDVAAIPSEPLLESGEPPMPRRLPRRWILWASAGALVWLVLLTAVFTWLSRG